MAHDPHLYSPFHSGMTTYGGFWVRATAATIDGLILLCAVLVVGLGLYAAGLSDSRAVLLASLSLIVAQVAYPWVCWVNWGATPGKMMFGLKVVDAGTGELISHGQVGLRLVGTMLSAMFWYLGFIWAAWDPRKQGWHDKIASTVVVRD